MPGAWHYFGPESSHRHILRLEEQTGHARSRAALVKSHRSVLVPYGEISLKRFGDATQVHVKKK